MTLSKAAGIEIKDLRIIVEFFKVVMYVPGIAFSNLEYYFGTLATSYISGSSGLFHSLKAKSAIASKIVIDEAHKYLIG